MADPLINPAAASAGTGFSRSFGDFVHDVTDSGISGLSALSGAGSGLASIIGSVITGIGNLVSQRQAANISKELYDYQTDYGKLMSKMTAAGINPGAAAQGLSNATPSMPSPSGMQFPDLSGLGQLSLNASSNPSVIAKNEAEALLSKGRLAEIGQIIDWNPRRWQAEIDNAAAQAGFYGSNSAYLDELKNTVIQKRPWEISSLQKGLQVMASEISKNLATASLMGKQGEYYGELSKGQIKLNFINGVRASFWRDGLNPDEPPFRSLLRLSLKDPRMAEGVVDKELGFLGILDDKISETFGKNWKRYAAGAAAVHLYSKWKDRKSARRLNNIRSIVGLAGIAGSLGTGSPAPAMIAPYFMGPSSSISSGQFINDPLRQFSFPFGATNMW